MGRGDVMNVQMKQGVHFWILDFPPDIGADDVDFLLRIAQLARENGVGECFQTFGDLEIIPCPDVFLWAWSTGKRRWRN